MNDDQDSIGAASAPELSRGSLLGPVCNGVVCLNAQSPIQVQPGCLGYQGQEDAGLRFVMKDNVNEDKQKHEKEKALMFTIQECEAMSPRTLSETPIDRIPAAITLKWMRETLGLPPEETLSTATAVHA